MADTIFARTFLSADDELNDWSTIAPYFAELRERNLPDAAAVERWLEDGSELMAAIEEVGTDRYVAMTCATDDEACKAAYLDFVENIEPRIKPCIHELHRKFVACSAARDLPRARYTVLDRRIRASVEIYREENVPLQTEEAKLEQRYQEITGAETVVFDGREQTLPQLALYAERTDRNVRQAAWEAAARRRLEDAPALEDLFDEMVQLRHRMAAQANCGDYIEYAFKAKQRFDYTPDDCLAFHEAVEKAVVPLARAMEEKRRKALGLTRLRPWDYDVDVKGRPPLKPFETVEQLCGGASRIFHRVDPELGAQFDAMNAAGYFDLESRKGKAPGGYQATYEASRHPFIFMNAVGLQRDVSTLLHEGGHAFHQQAARHDPILAYRSSPIEFAEVASFGMEMLSLDCLDEFYDDDEALARARRRELEGVVSLFPWVATIDAFQHALYRQPQHSRAQRRDWWLGLYDRFGSTADYEGYEQTLASAWHRQLHIFTVPLYYIEYGIAKLGALQIWRNARHNRTEAICRYRRALALGGSRPLPELFAAAGAKFDFSCDTLAPLMETVAQELESLPA